MPDPAWSADLLNDPHAVADKRRRVRDMFAAIAPSYDLNNRLHSFWQDQRWRQKAVEIAHLKSHDDVVDVACGTGDLTLKFAKKLEGMCLDEDHTPHAAQVTGVDFTFPMLELANRKPSPRTYTNKYWRAKDGTAMFNGLSTKPMVVANFLNGDAQQLPLPDACCDVISIAFGIRNVQNVDAALAEFYRVLRPGGRVIVLEFSEPTNPLIRAANRFYTGTIMPRTATWISRDKSGAYAYLPKSVSTFMTREQMAKHLADAGFTDLTQTPMTFGVCVCYRGIKR